MKRTLTIISLCLAVSACVSPQKTYHAPNEAKVRAATKDLTVKVTKARETAASSKKAVEDAKAIIDQSACANDAPLQAKIGEAISLNNQLQDQLAEAEKSRSMLQNEVDTYANSAASLAVDATNERNEKIEVQKKLLWYRLRFFGAWVALGLAVLAWIIFGVLKVGIKWGTK